MKAAPKITEGRKAESQGVTESGLANPRAVGESRALAVELWKKGYRHSSSRQVGSRTDRTCARGPFIEFIVTHVANQQPKRPVLVLSSLHRMAELGNVAYHAGPIQGQGLSRKSKSVTR